MNCGPTGVDEFSSLEGVQIDAFNQGLSFFFELYEEGDGGWLGVFSMFFVLINFVGEQGAENFIFVYFKLNKRKVTALRVVFLPKYFSTFF